jgi:hypothetical protein
VVPKRLYLSLGGGGITYGHAKSESVARGAGGDLHRADYTPSFFTNEVISDQTLEKLYYFIKPIYRNKNSLTVK